MRPVFHDNLMGAHIPHFVVDAFSPLVFITSIIKIGFVAENS